MQSRHSLLFFSWEPCALHHSPKLELSAVSWNQLLLINNFLSLPTVVKLFHSSAFPQRTYKSTLKPLNKLWWGMSPVPPVLHFGARVFWHDCSICAKDFSSFLPLKEGGGISELHFSFCSCVHYVNMWHTLPHTPRMTHSTSLHPPPPPIIFLLYLKRLGSSRCQWSGLLLALCPFVHPDMPAYRPPSAQS